MTVRQIENREKTASALERLRERRNDREEKRESKDKAKEKEGGPSTKPRRSLIRRKIVRRGEKKELSVKREEKKTETKKEPETRQQQQVATQQLRDQLQACISTVCRMLVMKDGMIVSEGLEALTSLQNLLENTLPVDSPEMKRLNDFIELLNLKKRKKKKGSNAEDDGDAFEEILSDDLADNLARLMKDLADATEQAIATGIDEEEEVDQSLETAEDIEEPQGMFMSADSGGPKKQLDVVQIRQFDDSDNGEEKQPLKRKKKQKTRLAKRLLELSGNLS